MSQNIFLGIVFSTHTHTHTHPSEFPSVAIFLFGFTGQWREPGYSEDLCEEAEGYVIEEASNSL